MILDSTQRHEQNSRIRSLVRFGLAKHFAKKDLGHAGADEVKAILTQWIGPMHPHLNALTKAAIAAASTTHPDWGSALVDTSFSDAFMARERRRTVLGAMLDSLRRVPFRSFVPSVQTGSTAEWRGQGRPAVVSAMVFDRISLTETTIAVISVITEELARNSDPIAVDLISSDLTTAIAEREDEALLSHDAAIADVRPAGLLNGLSSVGGGSPGSMEDDVAELIQAVRDGEAIAPFFVASRSGALVLARQRSGGERVFPGVRLTGGEIYGVPLVISKGANGNLVLIDAAALAVADAGVDISPSTQSAIQMDSAPTNDSITPTATQLVSLWQSNSIALRASRLVNWQKGYEDAVAYLSLEGGSPS